MGTFIETRLNSKNRLAIGYFGLFRADPEIPDIGRLVDVLHTEYGERKTRYEKAIIEMIRGTGGFAVML